MAQLDMNYITGGGTIHPLVNRVIPVKSAPKPAQRKSEVSKVVVKPVATQGLANRAVPVKSSVVPTINTVEDVKALQRRLGVVPDGIVGPKTNAAAAKAGINLAMTNADDFAPKTKVSKNIVDTSSSTTKKVASPKEQVVVQQPVQTTYDRSPEVQAILGAYRTPEQQIAGQEFARNMEMAPKIATWSGNEEYDSGPMTTEERAIEEGLAKRAAERAYWDNGSNRVQEGMSDFDWLVARQRAGY